MSLLGAVYQVSGLLFLLLPAYMVLYKSALIRLWWPLVAWALEPMGFRVVVMDRRLGLHAIRWVPPEKRRAT